MAFSHNKVSRKDGFDYVSVLLQKLEALETTDAVFLPEDHPPCGFKGELCSPGKLLCFVGSYGCYNICHSSTVVSTAIK